MKGVRNRSADELDATRRVRTRRPRLVGPADETHITSMWVAQWPRLEADLVRYLTYLLSGDTHAAQDVAQETAFRLWQHPEVVEGGEPLAGWLRTVARNIVIDRARRRRARPSEVALTPSIDRATPNSVDYVDHIDDASSLASILSVLAPWHRDVVYEVYVRDRSVADVAAELGIPVGTVKSRCHTAIHQLRATWGDALRPCA